MKSVIIILFLLFLGFSANSQNISLITSSITKKQKFYSLDGAELFLIVGTDTLFVPKDDKFQFSMPKTDTSIKQIKLLLKTCKYVYSVNLQREDLNYKLLRIGFFREKGKSYQLIDICMGECMSLVSEMKRVKRR